MPNYRRADIPGATYFFTVVSHQRRPIFCDDAVRSALRYAITSVKNKHNFVIDAWVLLPDHLHCIWSLPENDHAYSVRWSMIKRLVTQAVGTHYIRFMSRCAVRTKIIQTEYMVLMMAIIRLFQPRACGDAKGQSGSGVSGNTE